MRILNHKLVQILIVISCKQKLNTKISTKGEPVAVDDASGQTIWTNYFIESLGCQVNYTVVYHDNQSAVLLEKIVNRPAAAEHTT